MPDLKSNYNKDDKKYWLSSNRNDAHVKINNEISAIGLDYNESFLFQGAALVALIQGNSQCFGYDFQLQSVDEIMQWTPVFSASTNCFIPIENIAKKNTHYEHVKRHTELRNSADPLESLKARYYTVLLLRDFRWSQYHLIQRFALPWSKMYGNLQAETELSHLGYVTPMTPEEAQGYGCSVFDAPREWNSLLSQVTTRASPIVFCVGPRNTGKSTLNRFVINKMLSSGRDCVYFLDTDLGQTEFTCEGIVSLTRVELPLLGSPFTHIAVEPLAAKFIGSASPKFNPENYISAVKSLIEIYESLQEPKPALLVNTPGWIKGLGYDLLIHMLSLVQPTDLVVIDESNAPPSSIMYNPNLVPLASMLMANIEGKKPRLHAWLPAPHCIALSGSKLKFSSTQLRQLMTVSYFFQFDTPTHKPVSGTLAALSSPKYPRWRFQQPLLYQMPRCVPIDCVQLSFVSETVHASFALYAVNGTLVALCANGAHNFCGLGIVKSIDMTERKLWVITPMPLEMLHRRQVNAILRSPELDIPSFLRLDGAEAAIARLTTDFEASIPFIEFTQTSAQGDQVKKPRHNLVRGNLQ